MKNFNYIFVAKVVGFLLIVETLFMISSALVGEYYNETQATQSIYIAAIITLTSGLALLIPQVMSDKRAQKNVTKREGFVTVTLGWILMSAFGTLPYQISGAIPQFSNAFFETMSGFTTTGSSIILNIEAFPKSLLFWRSFTQWIGGIGIIVFVIGFMPLFGGSAIQLFDAEAPGFMHSSSMLRVSQIVKRFAITYISITIVGFLLLWAGPMGAFDAACHALTSISTGGFSTKQISIAHFQSAYVEYVIMLLMFIGGTNFMLLYLLFSKLSFKIVRDEEFRCYLFITLAFTLLISASLLITGQMQHVGYTIRTTLFQSISLITSTGFATYDYTLWGTTYWFLFVGLMLFCACEGSTSGGMKISRLVVLMKALSIEFKKQVHPNAMFAVKINGKVIQQNTVSNILAYIFLFLIVTSASFVILSLTGLTFEEVVGTSISAISNAGLALGRQGPSGNFAELTDFAKIYTSFLMLVGRLEIFTVLSLFIPSFWKR